MRFEEEEVRAVALGTAWVAAVTSLNFLRIFTEGGLQVSHIRHFGHYNFFLRHFVHYNLFLTYIQLLWNDSVTSDSALRVFLLRYALF